MVHPDLGFRYCKLEDAADEIRCLGYEVTLKIRRLTTIKE